MEQYLEKLTRGINTAIEAKQAFLKDDKQLRNFARATETIVNSYKSGGRLYIAGNGGSAADAQHLAAEFVCRMGQPRHAIPAEALTTDSSTITAIGNDLGYEHIFSRQIEAKATSNDVFLAISTSGTSQNILLALEKCQERQVKSVLLSGRDGGAATKLADHTILVPGADTSTIQEIHIVLCHAICGCVESAVL